MVSYPPYLLLLSRVQTVISNFYFLFFCEFNSTNILPRKSNQKQRVHGDDDNIELATRTGASAAGGKMSFKAATYLILKRHGSAMSVKEIIRIGLEEGNKIP